MRKLVLVIAAALAGLAATSTGLAYRLPAAGAAVAHAEIDGTGSSWAANAVNQWKADVQAQGLKVGFTSTGSAQGRQDFANGTTDFGVSDIGYQGVDPATGSKDQSTRPYAYLPIVSGGTSFPYHLTVAGKLVTNLRLSGPTIAKIFTNKITNWNDPAITADNNGHAFPSTTIVPVVHSEGSGSTYQFTAYLANQFPSVWTTGATEYFPRSGTQVAENGSDSVINFVTSKAGNGAIAFDEYSYALGAGYPVAKVLNTAGFYTLPNEYNVAVALTQAIINEDSTSANYLLQDLHNVYGYSDPRTYPLSSYSYGIIPTSASDARMTTAKRQTLADYLHYSICEGQAEAGNIGYSALPVFLVQAGFAQIQLLNKADPNVDVSQSSVTSCNNPTFTAGQPNNNHLAAVAPQPLACDKQGAGPCGVAAASTAGGAAAGGAAAGTTTKTGTAAGGAATAGATASGAAAVGGDAGTAAAGQIDPNTGQLVSGGGDSAGDAPNPTVLASSQSKSLDLTMAFIAAALLLALLIVPPIASARLRGRGGRK